MAAAYLLLVLLVLGASGRLPLSPFPLPSRGLNSSHAIFLFDESLVRQDDAFSVATLQGLLSRVQPQIYRIDGSNGDYPLWKTELEKIWSVRFDETFKSSLSGLLGVYKNRVKAFVLANLGDSSTSAALTICASGDYIALTPANENVGRTLGIPMLVDARGKDVMWAIATYNISASTFSHRLAVLQNPSKFTCLSDYAAFSRSITWWDGNMASPLSKRVFDSLQTPAILGWGIDEDGPVAAASLTGGWVHASDWAKNLDVFTSYGVPVPVRQPQRQTKDAIASKEKENLADVHTVAFLMTDGDNIQWLLNGFATGNQWWADKARGKVPMGWTLSPALVELAPTVLNYLYRTASPQDLFVAAPSGVGYSYPDLYSPSSLDLFSSITADYMAASDHRLLNIIGKRYSPSAASTLLSEESIDGLFWYDYYAYNSGAGNITFFNDKPVVSARYQLWDGTFDSVKTLIPKLLKMPKNPSSPNGYSLVTVHVWSNNVTDALEVTRALDSAGGFDVVTPDVLVQRVKEHLAPSSRLKKKIE